MICKWCHSEEAIQSKEPAYWEIPDGTRAVKITNVPSVKCSTCGIVYIEESLIEKIEDQFMIIDTKKLAKEFTYEELMSQPKLLKRNYFNF